MINNSFTDISLFENLPSYALIVTSKGEIIQYTKAIQQTVNNTDLQGINIKSIFPTIKNIKAKHGHEFDIEHCDGSNQKINFRVTVKAVEPKKNDLFIVCLKNITNELRQEKINRLLLNISKLESESDNINVFYKKIQDELNNLFDASNLYIVLFDKSKRSLNLAYISDKHNIQQPYPTGNTFALWIAQNAKAAILNESQIKRIAKKYSLQTFGPEAKCWMGVPLKSKNEIIGVIALQNYSSNIAFNKIDLELLQFISTQIATSIQRKENELELTLAKIKAEESDHLKSAFLANMSHEIRTPMNAILGFSELISRQSIQADKREIYTQHIISNGKLLLALVDDIIDLAKIEAGQINFRRSSTNIDEMLSELQQFCIAEKQRQNKDHLMIVRQSNRQGKQLMLLCDNMRVKQVLLNLLSNALKFTLDGSIEFGYELPNNATILFYVKDSGIGIAKDQQSIIFDRFRQVDDSATRQFGGTGLGLAISKKLVELMGGKIWVNSAPNEGATFYFTLPLIIPNEKGIISDHKVTRNSAMYNLKGKTILIAEDNNENFFYLNELLLPTKIQIIRASNGLEAIDNVKKNNKISIVLMDLQLPKLDGFKATKEIKRLNPKIPVITQTAYAHDEEKMKAADAGSDYYLVKPINSNMLLDLINRVLGNE